VNSLSPIRHRGALLGLAAGDALGTALEFRSPGTFKPISDMIGGGPFRLEPGQWTDDTSMALCLAESLIDCAGFDPADQMRRYLRWYEEGYLSCTGNCFDIGNTVRSALMRFKRTGDPYAGSTDTHSAGNGSLMRLAPIPMAYASDPAQAVASAADMSRTTHGAAEAVDACRYYAWLVADALRGADRTELTSDAFAPDRMPDRQPLAPRIAEIAAGSYKERSPPRIRGTGYVVDALEAALWAFWNTETFEQGALLAVNLGDDADTTGAMYGQLAGACYGADAIPAAWRERIAMRDVIERMADDLLVLANGRPSDR
jgi:ADP-ribosyl-[dinitrogen reductase] hydrolase